MGFTVKGLFALSDSNSDRVDFKMLSQIGSIATKESVHTRQRRQLNSNDVTKNGWHTSFLVMGTFSL